MSRAIIIFHWKIIAGEEKKKILSLILIGRKKRHLKVGYQDR